MSGAIGFGIFALGMVAAAIALIARPLWREARPLVIALVVAIPLATTLLYHHLGAPAIFGSRHIGAEGRMDVDKMLTALEARLQKNPDDAKGWFVLGQAYMTLGRQREAVEALAKAAAQAPREASYLAHYAEALALAAGRIDDKAKSWIDKALELEPEEEKAMELAGLAAYQEGQYATAAFYWRRLIKRLPESEYRDGIEAALKRAEAAGAGVAAPRKGR